MSGREVASNQKGVSLALKSPTIQKRIDELLGKNSAAFCSTLVQITRHNDKIAKCDPASVIGAAITAATLNLPINPNLAFAHIVPFGTEAQFQMGWRGYVQLAMRTGQYEKMVPFKVNRDAFISFNPITETLEVDQEKLDPSSEDIVGYGFYFKLTNGFEKMAYWTKERCLAHGIKYSQTYKRGFGNWVDMEDSMCMKTVIKMTLSHFGIMSVDMQNAFEQDQSVKHGIDDDGPLDYADNVDVAEAPLSSMKPEQTPAKEEEEPKQTTAESKPGPETKPPKTIRTLEVIEEKRPDDFAAACDSVGIPVNMWREASSVQLEILLADLKTIK